MEVAKLFDQLILIHQEWFEQISSGSPRDSVIQNLEGKYRIHSQKKVFECLCCSQPVTLVLREDSPHFRHQGDPCPSVENYERYITRVKKGEDAHKHRVGRAILRTHLEGQLKPHAITVQDGYMCKFALKIVPDFILTFPDNSIWAIDYITGSREDESYNNYIQKRTETYQAAGLKPFYFIDSSWLANVPDRSIISFYKAEQQMRTQSEIDEQWSSFVLEFIDVFGNAFVLHKWFGVQQYALSSDTIQDHNVFSLAYLDPGAGTAFIQRFIPSLQKKFGYHVYRASISIEQATSLDSKKSGFTWWEQGETEVMQQRLQILSSQYEIELELMAKNEQVEQQHRQLIEEHARQERLKLEQRNNFDVPSPTVTNKEPNIDYTQVLFNEGIINLIRVDMSIYQAWQLLSTVKANKNILSYLQLEQIRKQARAVLGSIKNPNPISGDLRRAMIDLAMVLMQASRGIQRWNCKFQWITWTILMSVK